MTYAGGPVPLPPFPCKDCGRLCAWRRAKELGLPAAGSQTQCRRCANRTRQRPYIAGRIKPRSKIRGVDEIVVERLIVGGYAGPVTTDELHEAVLVLDRQGMSARQIAIRIGCTTRTVQRHRTRARQEAA